MSLFKRQTTPIFLKEESEITQQIEKLKELQKQATGKIKDEIDKELTLLNYGEIGEKNIAFELKNAGIPMFVIHDLHLQHEDLTAQIDYVVITKKMVFFIECKNLYGNIEIDNQGNFVRSYSWNGRTIKEGIYSPITQNQRHLELYRQIRLAKQKNPIKRLGFEAGFKDFYKSIVVLSNPKTILNAKYAKKEVKEKVIRADQLIQHIKNQVKTSKEISNSEKGMKEWAQGFLDLHQPIKSDYTPKFKKQIEETNTIKDSSVQAEKENNEQLLVKAENFPKESGSQEIIDRLKDFRLKKSREENVKAYYIFNNKQMEDLIQKMPDTEEELLKVNGFGPVKTQKYGQEIINILQGN